MNKALELSLIIPAYNEEEHLKACLDSVAAQTVMPAEVVVVDNNSTDTTVAIAQNYPFVRVVTESKQGIVYARNAGFDAATQPLLGRIDADSILPIDWLERIADFYDDQSHATTAFTGGGRYYNTPFPRFSRWVLDVLAFRVNRIVLGHHFLFGSNMVVPSVVWQQVADKVCLRDDIHEDIDIAIHVHEAGYAIRYDKNLLVGVKLRRVFQDHNKLWGVLMLWPQSLRVHNRRLWFTGFVGAVLLYALTPLVYPLRAAQLTRLKLQSLLRR